MSGQHLDGRELRRALGCFATGVTVVTTVTADGAYAGLKRKLSEELYRLVRVAGSLVAGTSLYGFARSSLRTLGGPIRRSRRNTLSLVHRLVSGERNRRYRVARTAGSRQSSDGAFPTLVEDRAVAGSQVNPADPLLESVVCGSGIYP